MRVALFGGTFDPIHNAHLTIAHEARVRHQLDRVLFVPNGNPPHKADFTGASFEDRYRMVELACAPVAEFEPSRLEAGNAKSYSIHTIETVKASLGAQDRLFFLIGADAFAEIRSWYRSRDVLDAVEFIVVSRPGHEYAIPGGARVLRLETLALEVSSSEIRQELAAGGKPSVLPDAVFRYIRERGLYGATAEIAAQTRRHP